MKSRAGSKNIKKGKSLDRPAETVLMACVFLFLTIMSIPFFTCDHVDYFNGDCHGRAVILNERPVRQASVCQDSSPVFVVPGHLSTREYSIGEFDFLCIISSCFIPSTLPARAPPMLIVS